MTQPLSPAAQAICDALEIGHLNGPQQLVALAHANLVLRTAAMEIFPEERPPHAAMLEWLEKHPGDLPPWQSRAANREQLLAIATELHPLAPRPRTAHSTGIMNTELTPPNDLVDMWTKDWQEIFPDRSISLQRYISTKAADWQLKECARWSIEKVTEPSDEDLYDLAESFNGDAIPAMRRALELWGRPAPALAAGGSNQGKNNV